MANPFDDPDFGKAPGAANPFNDPKFGMAPAAPAPSMLDMLNQGVNWLGTRGTKALTGFADTANAMKPGGPLLEMLRPYAPDTMSVLYPQSSDLNKVIFKDMGVPEVNTPGRGGQMLDRGIESGLSALAFPGSVARNILPSVLGGGASELAGQSTQRSKWEAPARLFAGLGAGALSALGQNALGNAFRAVPNAATGTGLPMAPSNQQAIDRLASRALEEYGLTPQSLIERRAALGPGATFGEAGGPGVQSVVRGSTVQPGPARQLVEDVTARRLADERNRVGAAIDRNVGAPGLSSTIDEIIAQRRTAPTPLYEKAFANEDGTPRFAWNDRVQQFVEDPLFKPALAKGLEIQRIESLAKGEKFDPKAYGITGFADDGAPIIGGVPNMRALDAAKKGIDAILEGYRDKTSGRLVLDERGRAIDMARKAYVSTLDSLNDDYKAARQAYAEPSQLLDAAAMARQLFNGNQGADVTRKAYTALPDAAKEIFRRSVAEELRRDIGATDRGSAAAKIWGGQDRRDRLQSVMGPEDFKAFAADMENQLTIRKANDAMSPSRGSRTAFAEAEGQDNGAALEAARKALSGNYLQAITGLGRGIYDRVGQGRNKAVNEGLARMFMSDDPATFSGLSDRLQQEMMRQRLTAANRAGVLQTAPTVGALSAIRGGLYGP